MFFNNLTLWIVTPSWWPAKYYPQRLKKCIENAKKLWFKIKFMRHSLNSNWYISDLPENRAKDIHQAFLDPEVDIVMTMIWGNHSSHIIKYLDYDLIKENFKPFIGFSDITVLHYAIISQTGKQTYYGPAFMTQFGDMREELVNYTFGYLKKLVIQQQKNVIVISSKYYTDEFINWSEENRYRKLYVNKWQRWLKKGRIIWPIVWWCIPSLNRVIWTPYWIDVKDKIFFIDIPEWHCKIDEWLEIKDVDACFSQLDNIWVFNDIIWLIVSIPYGYDKKKKLELEKLILYYTKWKEYPVLMDVNLGHIEPIITIPYLTNVLLDSDKNLFVINYSHNE